MKLVGITDVIAGLELVRELREDLRSVRVFGLLNAAKPAVTSALFQEFSGSHFARARTDTRPAGSLAPTEGQSDRARGSKGRGDLGVKTPRLQALVVTAHVQAAQELAEELTHWTDLRVARFPALEVLPYERVRLDRSALAERQSTIQGVLDGEVDVVVAPVRALLQPVELPGGPESRGEPGASFIEIAAGQTVRVDELLGSLVDMGYGGASVVDQQGTFARRGGVLDVFPAGQDKPVRLELFGNEVESLRTFDPSSQRSIDSVERVFIRPLASINEEARTAAIEELAKVDVSTMHAEAQTRWEEDISRLQAGAPSDELSFFMTYLVRQPASPIDAFAKSSVVFVDTASETWSRMDDLWSQAREIQDRKEEYGDLPKGLRPALLDPDVVREAIRGRKCVEWMAGSAESKEDLDWSGLFVPAHRYAGRLREFVAASGGGTDLERITVVTSFQHERVAELLREDGVVVREVEDLDETPEDGMTILPASLIEGWRLPSEKIELLTDYELFGRARSRPVPRRIRPAREAFFADYAPGDYVVHVEHGIGRFNSVMRMSVDGAEREYALVDYAGTDRVYVPTDQLERLTRYVGVGDTPPTLNKLGGGEWHRSRQRAQQAADEIARELIDIYSKRMARTGYAFEPDAPWQRELETSFPYPETPDQLRAIEDVKQDMEAPRPMDRLVTADVGYGKTEVAVRAAFKAVMDGKQVALLAPTTILAQQHYETFKERFAAFPASVEVLSRFRNPSQQREILRKVATGEVDVLIGTHRILSKDVVFKNLGLLIIDEEQRFGVRHKEALKKLRESIDVLTLTATPIPRTLHMGLVGIREISVIETAPEGRLPIKTYLQPFDEGLIREAVLRELGRGGQVYIVHNKVATIEAMAERVRRLVPEARLIVGHGQMDEAQLEKAMMSFAHGEADALVSSTIIENGLDIPNVNTIVINNAHRLGLTQMYQLRGRVGRSANQAYAYLLYPRDARLSHEAMQRMEAVFEAQELGAGFNIAMRDLEIRGAGNLLGAEQSGHATAIGFDLYTRMIGDAVERLKGIAVEEPVLVSLDLPLTMFLPAEYVGDEGERLSLYRRLAAVQTQDELDSIEAEIRDRFGPPPYQVENLIRSVHLKLMAIAARVMSISLNDEALIVRAGPGALYDRVSLYRKYGTEARISTNVLRLNRRKVPEDWMEAIEEILSDMARLRESVGRPEAVAG